MTQKYLNSMTARVLALFKEAGLALAETDTVMACRKAQSAVRLVREIDRAMEDDDTLVLAPELRGEVA